MATKAKMLRLIHLRLRIKDIIAAKKHAGILGLPYQHIIRAWVAEMADRLPEK